MYSLTINKKVVKKCCLIHCSNENLVNRYFRSIEMAGKRIVDISGKIKKVVSTIQRESKSKPEDHTKGDQFS